MSLTKEQLRRVDREAVSRYGMTGLILMENAGRGAADIIHRQYGSTNHRRAIIICGPGNNGGDGCVIARHLHNHRWETIVFIVGHAARLTPDTRTNLTILENMASEKFCAEPWASARADVPDEKVLRHAGDRYTKTRLALSISIITADAVSEQLAAADYGEDIIVDCLLGTGFTGEVRSPLDVLIHLINNINKRATVAIDVPSGLECDTGKASNATIQADLTITFVARKRAFDLPDAANYTGRIEVADIGAPQELIAQCAANPGC